SLIARDSGKWRRPLRRKRVMWHRRAKMMRNSTPPEKDRMRRIIILAVLASLSSPVLAAGGWDDLPTPFKIYAHIVSLLFCAVPSVGPAFFLQGLMRLRYALLVVSCGVLFLSSCVVQEHHYARLAPAFAMFLSLFAILFCLGWFFGKRVR